VLLVGAGLLLTSFLHIAAIDQGFKAGNVFVAEADLSGPRYKNPQVRIAFFNEVLSRAAVLPGVQSVGAATKLPLTGASEIRGLVPEGDSTPFKNAPQAEYRIATPGYFATMNIPILRGRVFDDRTEDPRVALISERTAQRLWPAQDPIGRRFKDAVPENWRGPAPKTVTVVGVVGDVRSTVPNSDPTLMVYLPPAQNPPGAMTFVIRTAGIEPPIRQVVKEVDPLISLGKVAKVDDIVSASTAARRFQMTLLASFAIVALLLACLGIYGVVSFSVAQRRSELGLRLALGAQARDIASLVLKEGMKPVFVGVVAGLLAALLVARLISSLLFGVTPIDPATYALAATILLTVAAAACWIPARGAIRIDPIETLRCE